jgi:hypothetical protein
MVPLLSFLLILVLACLAFTAYYAFQLRITVARLETETAAQRSHYDQDHKQWTDSTAALKVQYNAIVAK